MGRGPRANGEGPEGQWSAHAGPLVLVFVRCANDWSRGTLDSRRPLISGARVVWRRGAPGHNGRGGRKDYHWELYADGKGLLCGRIIVASWR